MNYNIYQKAFEITENSKDFVKITNIKKNDCLKIIIEPYENYRLHIKKGRSEIRNVDIIETTNISKDNDNISTLMSSYVYHTFILEIIDKNGNSIDLDTKIQIDVEKITGNIIRLARLMYSDLNTVKKCLFYKDINLKDEILLYTYKDNSELFRFGKDIIIKDTDKLIILIKNSNVSIEDVKFVFTLDLLKLNKGE